ncbi:MAG: hypothetical protein QGH66_04940 [Dehalococcoidia bacterium]|nr:hypothetical protein [Dehalococcoidia bacterium]MDP7240511.1 hypothetical protein [Dehalococcoidia bacterium]MDP7469383.1 hypothetical protein [Dehalococcoidia bacterium]
MSVKCALCGCVFEPEEQSCAVCPTVGGCRVICCPRCGYAVPGESSLVQLWRRIRRKTNAVKGMDSDIRQAG